MRTLKKTRPLSRKAVKTTAALTAAALTFALTGCGGTASTSAAASSAATTSSTASSATTEAAPAGDVTLKIWGKADTWLPSGETEISSSHFLEELQKQTGVTIDLTAASGTVQEQFNLMIAGGKDTLPDIIDNTNLFDGGAQGAYDAGYIVDLTPYIDEYAPNYRKYLDEHPEIDRLMKTEDGKYLTFPMVRGDDALCCFNGFIVRKDWLDKAGLEAPVTMDDWYNMLTTFKNDFGADSPLVIDAGNTWHYTSFAQAYGASDDYFQQDGTIKFGPVQPGFKDFLTEMNKWYSEGLLDANFLTSDGNARDAAISSGEAGAYWGAVGGGIGKFMDAVTPTNPEFELNAVTYPVLKAGDTPMIGYKADAAGNSGMSISTNCKNIEAAVKFLDYGYSEAGNMLYNYGTEGVSYTMVDGKATYTDLITKNPDGLTVSQAMGYYIGANHMNGGFVQEMNYYNQYLARQQQKDAIKTWSATDAKETLLPPYTLTSEESSTCAAIDTEIRTYVDESVAAFITGDMPISEFDNYVATVYDMGLEDTMAIKQAALERFNAK